MRSRRRCMRVGRGLFKLLFMFSRGFHRPSRVSSSLAGRSHRLLTLCFVERQALEDAYKADSDEDDDETATGGAGRASASFLGLLTGVAVVAGFLL